MPQTQILCPNCKTIFNSPIAFGDRKSFESSILSGNVTNCPKCGSLIPCNKENMIFKE